MSAVVSSTTIDKLDIPIVDGVTNVMVPNINMFCAGMKLTLCVDTPKDKISCQEDDQPW